MTEDTTIIQKSPVTAGTGNGSSIAGISVRGMLALILTVTVCGITATNIVMACLGYTSTNVTIPEPLYSGFMTALGFYLGQKSNKV